ncbi:MAG: tRNA pseudouridine(38-40) synthase TruA [Thermodesulfobacteriota bacterium]
MIEYEGTNYSGWQIQSTLPTIQGTVEKAIFEFTGERVKLFGASRTDAGVHALGQVANFQTASIVEADKFATALNGILPLDIVIKEASEADIGFHASMQAKEKLYLYRIERRRFRSALSRKFAWHVFMPLDVELMREGASRIIGERDFSSFMADGSRTEIFVREISSITIIEEGDFLEIQVRGNSFLRHMVRIMVGTLVALGKGKLSPKDIDSILEAKTRSEAGETAPPEGLCLLEVVY